MARNPRRSVISSAVLKGYILEEVVAYLISNAGYQLLTDPQDDPYDLTWRGNGLQVRGRGGLHQADVLGELLWAPAFGNPIRLFVEAKWRGGGRNRVGIPEVRQAVGVIQDVNQSLTTIDVGFGEFNPDIGVEDTRISGRGFCYAYRYALCSSLGFTSGAQAYALAHQISLLDLSHEDYKEILGAVDRIGDELVEYIEYVGSTGRGESRNKLVKSIRSNLRSLLWNIRLRDDDKFLLDIIRPLIEKVRSTGELFVGVSATGFVILLKADNPRLMIEHMLAENDPDTEIYYSTKENGSTQWRIKLISPGVKNCTLSFAVPDAMISAINEKIEIDARESMLNLKRQHLSRITVYRVTKNKSLMCALKLNEEWYGRARELIENKRR